MSAWAAAAPAIAILAMATATYLCRASGVVLMSRIAITPRIERALRALPGSIVAATVLPLALDGGPPALLGIAAAVVVMRLTRFELAALVAGLAAVALLRAAGL
ncbi:MAG TPA: AzlD domain-containing protein [Microvirga sp.]|jgi:uncharacterized membrane protein|nr:AzlD domain-containing protein [Microvirga sp.]